MLNFKHWLENEVQPPSVALVGWTGSSTDQALITLVGDFFTDEQSPHFDSDMYKLWSQARFDKININEGRDFLEERQTYTVVVLCWIFNPRSPGPHYTGEYQLSPKHTQQEWKNRLLSTKAHYIFASGSGTEVSADFIGPLPGYYTKKITPSITVYMSWSMWS